MKRSKQSTRPQSKPQPPQPLPNNYVCIAPEESQIVFNYLSGLEDADEAIVTLHVKLCARCQETIMRFQDIDRARKVQLRMAEAL